MRGWMTAMLVVTFLSGGSTGFLIARNSTPAPVSQTWIDQYVEQARKEGVTDSKDLSRIRELAEEWDHRIHAFQKKVEARFAGQLDGISQTYQRKIDAIIDKDRKR